MTRKVHVAPGGLTQVQAKAGIVIAVLFLFFGLTFGAVVWYDMPRSEVALKLLTGAFFLIWVVACVAIILFNAKWLAASRRSQPDTLLDLQIEASGDGPDHDNMLDFEQRLRKLEVLKRDGLVSDAEYAHKRREILRQKW